MDEPEQTKAEGPNALEAVSYVHVMLGELQKLVRHAGDKELSAALREAQKEAEAALKRAAQSIVKAARGDAA